ncbi:hypothetical protein HQ314_16140 [Rhodococcus sp. BP-332]|uniref:hypothetical protein n=1 Tax=Rhodococcus sp. BP-332 TaxID=2739447 RepID=UPI001C9AE1F9|nr:hypothetical protein [Rhodococcus sp. BP-332]MBY6678450.1 hypothetical protein [Rhodococcus sp. BP-332]
MSRPRSVALVLIAAVLTVVSVVSNTDGTVAAWQGRDHAAATVSIGSWPSAGSAYAEIGRVGSASGLAFDLLAGGTNPPWPGPAATRSQAAPGTVTSTTAGPYSSAGVLGLANELTSRGAAPGTPIQGSSCAAYGWAPNTPAPCTTVPSQRVNARATLSSYTLYASLLSLLGLGSTDVVSVPSPVTSAASCDLTTSGPTYTATPPSAANVTTLNPRGSITVRGGNAVAIPPAGGTVSFDFPQSGSTVVVPGVSGTLRSVVDNSSSARSSLVLENGRILRLGLLGGILLDIRFTLVLVDAACGGGPTGPVSITAASARVAAAEPPAATTPVTTTPVTTTPVTTTAAATTAAATTAAATTPVTTTSAQPSASSVVSPTDATTIPASSSTAATTTTSPAPTTTTTTPAAASATVFSGAGPITSITTSDGLECSVGPDAVTFTCSDGSTLVFTPVALSPPGIAAATTDGLWSPRTLTGETVPVEAATRS